MSGESIHIAKVIVKQESPQDCKRVYNKSKGTKQSKAGKRMANREAQSGGLNATSNNCHYDSSLGLLKKTFVKLIQEAEDGTLDLNYCANIWRGADNLGQKDLGDQIASFDKDISYYFVV